MNDEEVIEIVNTSEGLETADESLQKRFDRLKELGYKYDPITENYERSKGDTLVQIALETVEDETDEEFDKILKENQ